MKNFFTLQFLTLLFTLCLRFISAQNLTVVGPPDIVASAKLQFNINDLKDPNNATFGRFVFDLTSRKKVVTHDLVCYKYCRKNLWTKYPGFSNQTTVPKPSPRQACEYYNSYFDTAHKDRKYELVWGFDGYATGDSVKLREIQVNDFRHCTEGLIQRIFIVEDIRRNIAQDTQDIWVVDCDYEYPIAMGCQINRLILQNDCELTLLPSMVYSGSINICNSLYIIEVRDWNNPGSNLIDRNPNKPGVQLNKEDINKEIRVSLIDPVTGNSCWTKAVLEYESNPKLTCPKDITVSCLESVLPIHVGQPIVESSCINQIISYKDDLQKGSCSLGYSWFIIRTWIVKDDFGKSDACQQHITVDLGDFNAIQLPKNYNDIGLPSLLCSTRLDSGFNTANHILNSPQCVDGFLLDTVFWLANANEPDIFPNRRRPRTMGWNMIVDMNSPSGYVPSPDAKYYPSYSILSNGKLGCWGDNEYVQWTGTGRPGINNCIEFSATYKDSFLNVADIRCNNLRTNCFKILRKWTLLNWCTGQIKEYVQEIKIKDNTSPQFTYPSTFNLEIDSNKTAEWNVPAPMWIDDCSESIYYYLESNVGTIVGSSMSGYFIRNLPLGDHKVRIIVSDCCGNIAEKEVLIRVRLSASVSNTEIKSLLIFPNPNQGSIKITSSQAYDQIIIQSIDGKILMQCQKNTSEVYNLESLHSGVYFIHVLFKNEAVEVEKIVVD